KTASSSNPYPPAPGGSSIASLEQIHPHLIWPGGAAVIYDKVHIVVLEDLPGLHEVEALGGGEVGVLVREGADDQQPPAPRLAGVDVEVRALPQVLFVLAIHDERLGLAEGDELAVEVQQGVRVPLLDLDVHVPVVLVEVEPGPRLGDAGPGPARPL